MKNIFQLALLVSLALFVMGCSPGCAKKNASDEMPADSVDSVSEMSMWLTLPDQTALMTKQSTPLNFGNLSNQHPTIKIDATQSYQSMDGFGFSLTGGSARLINELEAAEKNALLNELFATENNSIGISYLRISIGASDLSDEVFTYDEMPAGEIDPELEHFSIAMEQTDLIPVLKQILAINPEIKIMGSPWTAPTWMKTNGNYKGGSLKPEYYDAYARYFVTYIEAMAHEGIVIDAITIQNEPLHPGNTPSMLMLAADQAVFIKNHLGPLFETSGIKTKIIIYDHNADRPDYPISILDDPEAAKYIDGSAFHLYGGDISALTQVHNAHSDKHLYFTEQWVGGPSNFGGDLQWHIENLIIGASRNWSRVVLEWNLAADPDYLPHTDGGCTNCLGALTIGTQVSRNVAYYIIAHASKFVRPGSVRIASNIPGKLKNVAFLTPAGHKVLVVINSGDTSATFNIEHQEQWATTTLVPGAVATYVW